MWKQKPLTPKLGSEITGLDLARLSDADVQSLSQALRSNQADHKIQLGLNISHGLGAGSRPDIGRAAAEEAIDEILTDLEGAHMAFVTAGMPGGDLPRSLPAMSRATRLLAGRYDFD